jgi:hypothetical protein
MAFSSRLLYQPRQTLDSATFDGTYQLLGTLNFPGAIVKIVNLSGVNVDISTDAVNDHDIVPSGGFTLYDCVTNHANATPGVFVPSGTSYYVKGATASTGLVYLVIQYIPEL